MMKMMIKTIKISMKKLKSYRIILPNKIINIFNKNNNKKKFFYQIYNKMNINLNLTH
jgi:hypothetical protein